MGMKQLPHLNYSKMRDEAKTLLVQEGFVLPVQKTPNFMDKGVHEY